MEIKDSKEDLLYVTDLSNKKKKTYPLRRMGYRKNISLFINQKKTILSIPRPNAI